MSEQDKKYPGVPSPGVYVPPSKNSLMDELQKAKMEMDYAMKQMLDGPYVKTRSRRVAPPDLNQQIDQRLSRLQEESTKLLEAKEKLKELKFKAGDVAFHKDFGNVLIRQVLMRDDYNLGRDFSHIPGDFAYEIVTMDGPQVVATEDVLPITELNKVLYGK